MAHSVALAIQEAETEELPETGSSELQWAMIVPLHSILGDKDRPCLLRKIIIRLCFGLCSLKSFCFPEDVSIHVDEHAICLTHYPTSSSALMTFASTPLKLPQEWLLWRLSDGYISEILNSNILSACPLWQIIVSKVVAATRSAILCALHF